MINLSATERDIVGLVARYVDSEVRPVVRELEQQDTYPEKIIEQMKEMGIYGMCIPEPYGEFGVSTPCFVLVTEELARGWMSLAGAFGGHAVVSKLILRFGTEEQRLRYLPRMATGELRAAMALTEPGGGSDLQAIRTMARRRRELMGDHWIEDVDHQRAPRRSDRRALQDRRLGDTRGQGNFDPAGRGWSRIRHLSGPVQVGLQGHRDV